MQFLTQHVGDAIKNFLNLLLSTVCTGTRAIHSAIIYRLILCGAVGGAVAMEEVFFLNYLFKPQPN